jgi:CheY-like chemotaxis protein
MMNKPLHFLLVEDDEDHARLVMVALADNRVANTVHHVTDGAQALAYLRGDAPFQDEPRPDVVLLDLKLPKIDGQEVLRQIKEDEALRVIPVVILTSSDAETDRARAYFSHANSFLTKPIDFGKFHQMIHDLQCYWTVWNKPPQNRSSGRRSA